MFLLNDATHRMLMRFDSKIGHRYVSNLVARVPHETGGYLVRTNSSGFRSDLEFKAKRSAVPRILVLGDSFTAGEGCASQQRYPELLGQALGAEVYNYGVSGSAPDQHLLCFREFGREVEADLIIWGIPLHNIERIKLTHRPSKDRISGQSVLVPKPYFTFEQDRLELHHVPVPRLRPEPSQSSSHQYTESVNEAPILERLLRLSGLERYRDLVQHLLPGMKERLRALTYRISNTQLYEDYLDEQSTGWTLLSALIRQLRVEVLDIPILVVPLPTYHYYIDRLAPVHDALYKSLEDPAGGLFVSAITNALHANKTLAERKAICFPVDTHYSPFGHQEIARILAADIQERKLLGEHSIAELRNVSGVEKKKSAGKFVLGLAFGSADASAALVLDGKIIAFARESSFKRGISARGFPNLAVNYCLEEARISQNDLSAIVYGCELSSDFKLETKRLFSNTSRWAWINKMSDWVSRELNVYPVIREQLKYDGLMLESASFASQCASAFYASPFSSATVINFGDASIIIAQGGETGIKLLKEYSASHALQTFKSAMAHLISGKSTGAKKPLWSLALRGEPVFVRHIFSNLLEIKNDGSIELNPDYFSDALNEDATLSALESFFEMKSSKSKNDEKLRANLAKSTQIVISSVIVQVVKYAREVTELRNLCVAGPLVNDPDVHKALVEANIFDNIWHQPFNGTASSALGAALLASFEYLGVNRTPSISDEFSQSTGLLGPEYSNQEIDAFIDTFGYPSRKYCVEERINQLAAMIADGKVIGHFSGRLGVSSEYAGDRLILGSLKTAQNFFRSLSNNCDESDWEWAVAIPSGSPFSSHMQCCGKATLSLAKSKLGLAPKKPNGQSNYTFDDDTTLEGNAVWGRVIHETASPNIYAIIRRLELLTDSEVVAATNFESSQGCTVCTPFDAYFTFMKYNIDVLVLGEHILLKEDQPPWPLELKITPAEQFHETGAVSKKLVGRLNQLFQTKIMPTVFESQKSNSAGMPLRIKQQWQSAQECVESPSYKLVCQVPPELEHKSIRAKPLAKLLARSIEPKRSRELFQEIIAEIIRLNRRFY